MTVSTITSSITYLGNGATTAWTFSFIGVASTDLEVIVVDSSGNSTTISPSLYTVTINAIPVGGIWGIGGTVTYPLSGSPLATGNSITINRIVPFTQSISINNQGAFYPQAVEQGLDILELQIQQLETDNTYTLKTPVTDVTPPTVLPSAALRANKYLAFDSQGDPVVAASPQVVTTSSLPTVATIVALKALAVSTNLIGSAVYVNGYYSNQDGGEGIFTVTTTNPGADNGGTVIWSNTAGYYFIRDTQGKDFSVKWFGAKGDTSHDDTTAIQSAITAAQAVVGTVYFPSQASNAYKVTSTLNVTGPVKLKGSTNAGTSITGYGMSTGTFVLHLNGTGSTVEGIQIEDLTFGSNGSTADLIKVNKISNSSFRNIFLRDARYGIVITGSRTFSLTFDCVKYIAGSMTITAFYTAFTGGGQHLWTGCNFGGGTGTSVSSDSNISGLTFVQCNWEGCTTNAMFVAGTITGLTFIGPRSEANICSSEFNIRPSVGNFVDGLVCIGGFFDGGTVDNTFALGGDTGHVRGFLFAGNYVYHYGAYFVLLNGDGQSGTITGTNLSTGAAVTVNSYSRSGTFIYNNEIDGVTDGPTFGIIQGSATYDPGSLADGAGVTTTVTCTGAVLGDFAVPSFSLDLQGITVTAYVSTADTVAVRFQNESGGVLDLASGTLLVKVIKK